MTRYNDKQKIVEYYDLASPHYAEFWGDHLHHGYWATGSESKEEAQLALVAHLADIARIPLGASILDVGCGVGASSIYLAETYQATCTGITISPIQAAMARRAAEQAGAASHFLVMDADRLSFLKPFDVVWSVEAISHFHDRRNFFAQAATLLKPGATLALIDWFKRDGLTSTEYRDYIVPIERGMFVELDTMDSYRAMIGEAGLEIAHSSDLSAHCAKTWDVSGTLLQNRGIWELAGKLGLGFVRFLRAFSAMKKGFASGSFVFGLIVAHRNS
jgi:tocopherol O-methyltransferase